VLVPFLRFPFLPFLFLLYLFHGFCFPFSDTRLTLSHSGRAYNPNLMFTWPNAKTSVMGAEQLSSVMEAVGKKVDPELKSRIERESEVTFGSARLWDDGVIPPAHTRRVLGLGLRMAMQGPREERQGERDTEWGVFRM
jgi:3-methylcrotonyl-CoA carboxylase beta subunit